MSSLTVALTVIFSAFVLLGSNRTAALAVMATICYTSISQQSDFGGMHFWPLRMILLIAMARIIIRGDFKDVKLHQIDWLVVAFTSMTVVMSAIRSDGDMQTLVYEFGQAYDIVISYFAFRSFLKNCQDVEGFLASLAFIVTPLAFFMIVQSVTETNLLPGAVTLSAGYVREGRIRCNGSFSGPITAGIFGATLMPLFVGLYSLPGRRRAALIGVLSATAITVTSNSSGPLMAFITGLLGLIVWPWRNHIKTLRWGIVAVLALFAIVMKAPLWYLPAKISGLSGGDGWHRSYLMEQAIRHFPDWWLLGTNDTGDWMPYKMLSGQADITNQYISAGINGGLVGLIIFISIIVVSFHNIGVSLRQAQTKGLRNDFFLWSFGAVLCAHAVTLNAVTYFDQMGTALWAFLALLFSTTVDVMKKEPPPLLHRESRFEVDMTKMA